MHTNNIMARLPPKSTQGTKPAAGASPPAGATITRRVTRNSPVKAPQSKPTTSSRKARTATTKSTKLIDKEKDKKIVETEGIPTRRTQRSPTKRQVTQIRPTKKQQQRQEEDDGTDGDSRHFSDNQESEVPKEADLDERHEEDEEGSDSDIMHFSDNQESEEVPKETNQEENFIHEGRNIFALMNEEEVIELLDRIDQQCSPLETLNARKRELSIKWNNVSFSSYGPRQCQAVWVFLRHHARKVRILQEVVNEVKFKFNVNKAFQTKLIESLPGFPQKPANSLGGFQCFNREMWEKLKEGQSSDLPNYIKFQRECKEKWDKLSINVKSKYNEKAALADAEYKRQVKEFYAKNPGLSARIKKIQEAQTKRKRTIDKLRLETRKLGRPATVKIVKPKVEKATRKRKLIENLPNPYEDAPVYPQSPAVLFIQSKLNRLDTPPTAEELPVLKNKFFDKWKGFSDSKRVRWVDACLKDCMRYTNEVIAYQQDHPEYIPSRPLKVRSICTKDELALWANENGFPSNPKSSVFDVFNEEFIESNDSVDLPEDERRKVALIKWNDMDWYHKEMFKMQYKISIVEYKKQIQTFFSTLPEFLKPTFLAKVPKRFLKMVNEIDKVSESECLEPAAELGSLREEDYGGSEAEKVEEMGGQKGDGEEPPRKKKKKDKKKKRKEQDSNLEEGDEQQANIKYEEDQYRHFENHEDVDYNQSQVELEEPEEVTVRPKKKKKKKHREHSEEGEPETITGDLYSDSYSESQTDTRENNLDIFHGESNKRLKAGKSGSIYGVTLRNDEDNDVQPHTHKKSNHEKIQKAVATEVEKMKAAWNKPIKILPGSLPDAKKPSSKNFHPGNIIVQSDIYEAVRGIFDGRPHLRRHWSVYYYYAKYVATDKVWIDHVNEKGLEKSALKIIETFLSLNDHQKDLFINQSTGLHLQRSFNYRQNKDLSKRNYLAVLENVYPGEPMRPPRLALSLYKADMKKRKGEVPNFEYPRWKNLDESTKVYYIKRLYHDTRTYMKRYDKFISSLTPYDLADYACFKVRKQEELAYTQQSIVKAAKGFIFPFSNREMDVGDVGEESEPEMLKEQKSTPGKRLSKRKTGRPPKSEQNPFAEDDETKYIRKQRIAATNARSKILSSGRQKKYNTVNKRRSTKSKRTDLSDSESDYPSDDEKLGFSLYDPSINKKLQAKKVKYQKRKKIKQAEKYYYPMDDIIDKIKNPTYPCRTTCSKDIDVEDSSTQTVFCKFRARGTQTLRIKLVNKGTNSHETEEYLKSCKSSSIKGKSKKLMPKSYWEFLKTLKHMNERKSKKSQKLKLLKALAKKKKDAAVKTINQKSNTGKSRKPRKEIVELDPAKILRKKEAEHAKVTAERKRFLVRRFSAIACDVVVPKRGRRKIRFGLKKKLLVQMRGLFSEGVWKNPSPMGFDGQMNSNQQKLNELEEQDTEHVTLDSAQTNNCETSLNLTSEVSTHHVLDFDPMNVVDVVYEEDLLLSTPKLVNDLDMPAPLQPLTNLSEDEMYTELVGMSDTRILPNSELTDLTPLTNIDMTHNNYI